jgi:hypothetical protein
MSNQRIRNLLYMSEGTELGSLEVMGVDNFWVYGRFHPTPHFETYRQLFIDLERAWKEDESEQAYKLQEQVNDLGLIVGATPTQAHPIRDFKIMNGQYEYKLL